MIRIFYTIMIRPYTQNDKEAVLALIKLNTPKYFAEAEEQDLVTYLEQEIESYFVIEEEGEIIGAGGINWLENKTEARISWDMFHPKHQGKGLGSQLTQYRIEQIKTIPTVEKIVVRTTQLVFPFYAKQGFQLQYTIKDYWATGFDLYHMEILL